MTRRQRQTSFCKRCHRTEIAYKTVEGKALFACAQCGRKWTRPVINPGKDNSAAAGGAALAGAVLGAAVGGALMGLTGFGIGGVIGAGAGASLVEQPPHEDCFRCGGKANIVGKKGNQIFWQCAECGRFWKSRRN